MVTNLVLLFTSVFFLIMYIGDLPACLSVRYVWEVPLEVDSLGLALHIVRNLRVDAGKQPRVLWNGAISWLFQYGGLPTELAARRQAFLPVSGRECTNHEPCICNFLWKVLPLPCSVQEENPFSKGGRHTACNDCHPGAGWLFLSRRGGCEPLIAVVFILLEFSLHLFVI